MNYQTKHKSKTTLKYHYNLVESEHEYNGKSYHFQNDTIHALSIKNLAFIQTLRHEHLIHFAE